MTIHAQDPDDVLRAIRFVERKLVESAHAPKLGPVWQAALSIAASAVGFAGDVFELGADPRQVFDDLRKGLYDLVQPYLPRTAERHRRDTEEPDGR